MMFQRVVGLMVLAGACNVAAGAADIDDLQEKIDQLVDANTQLMYENQQLKQGLAQAGGAAQYAQQLQAELQRSQSEHASLQKKHDDFVVQKKAEQARTVELFGSYQAEVEQWKDLASRSPGGAGDSSEVSALEQENKRLQGIIAGLEKRISDQNLKNFNAGESSRQEEMKDLYR